MLIPLSIIIAFFSLVLPITGRSLHSDFIKTSNGVNDNYVLIKYNQDLHHWIFKNVKPATLSSNELKLVGEIIQTTTDKYNTSLTNSYFYIKPLSTYKKQIIPVINMNREKEVWINCFCRVNRNNWRKEIVLVDDGGSCYFRLKINLSTKTGYQLAVNGEG